MRYLYWASRSFMIFSCEVSSAGSSALIDAGDQFGRTALMFAVLVDKVDVAEWLLKNGANIRMKDKGGRTALHWAAHKV